jgi:hypothetical protein
MRARSSPTDRAPQPSPKPFETKTIRTNAILPGWSLQAEGPDARAGAEGNPASDFLPA